MKNFLLISMIVLFVLALFGSRAVLDINMYENSESNRQDEEITVNEQILESGEDIDSENTEIVEDRESGENTEIAENRENGEDVEIVENMDSGEIIDQSENKENIEENQVVKNGVIHLTENDFESEVLNCESMVLVDFYADWCAPCKKISPIIEELAKEKTDVKFVKINVDENEKLATKYKIQYLPTLVVFEGGKEKDRSIGLVSKETIVDMFID